ncbi:MAG: hypothetical protein JWN76_3080 [Chitinophagaceae bacterium]|nr:hypothetical protein [Chitinophagaceae bacterium]
MKALLFLATCSCLATAGFSQDNNYSLPTGQNVTKITILGSPHRETVELKKGQLYEAINQAKPDLILFELDSSLFEKDFRFPKSLLNYFEVVVVDSFIKNHPLIQVRPFDIEKRNQFFIKNHYFEEESLLFSALDHLYRMDSLTLENKIIYEAYLKLSEVLNHFSESSLYAMNLPAVDALAAAKMKWYHGYYSKLINTTPTLIPYYSHFVLDSTFWINRNNVMAEHIINFSQLYPGKNIVIITGHYHRYYLRELLLPQQAKYHFMIREFYD